MELDFFLNEFRREQPVFRHPNIDYYTSDVYTFVVFYYARGTCVRFSACVSSIYVALVWRLKNTTYLNENIDHISWKGKVNWPSNIYIYFLIVITADTAMISNGLFFFRIYGINTNVLYVHIILYDNNNTHDVRGKGRTNRSHTLPA